MSRISDLVSSGEAAANGVSEVTQTVRAGLECGDATGCVVPPMHLTSTFAFRAFGEKRAYDYTRSGNPTRDLLAAALAELEQGAGAVVTATGMAAITLIGYLVPAGARIVAPHDCYGGTYRLFDAWRRRGEREVEFVNFGDEAAVRAALTRPTALLWIETPSNPLLRITDIAAFAALGRASGALVVVDNTFLSPAWQQPLTLGADLVVHSTTKYLNGHSDVVGGAVVARDKALQRAARLVGELPRRHRRAVRQLHDAAGPAHAARAPRAPWAQRAGARALAQRSRPTSGACITPASPSHPGHASAAAPAARLRRHRHPRARGRARRGARVRLRPAVLLAGRVPGRRREPGRASGHHDARGDGPGGAPRGRDSADGLIRLSVGIEALEDLREDLARALERAARARPLARPLKLAAGSLLTTRFAPPLACSTAAPRRGDEIRGARARG